MSMNTHITSELRLFQEKKKKSEWCPDWTQYPLNHPVGEDVKCSVSAVQDHLRSSNELLRKPHKERRKRGNAT